MNSNAPIHHQPQVWFGLLGLVSLLAGGFSFWSLATYTHLDHLKTSSEQAWEELQTQYEPRFDLIPVYADSLKTVYASEREIFDYVAETRQNYALAGGAEARVQAVNLLETALDRTQTMVEMYPALSASASVQAVTTELATTQQDLEQPIANYNTSVERYNHQLTVSWITPIAELFGFEPATRMESL